MSEKDREETALVRYSVIAPLVTHTIPTYMSNSEYFKQRASEPFITHNGIAYFFSAASIERWYYLYMKYGFDALKPRKRSDSGCIRKLDDEVVNYIRELKKTFPRMPSTEVYDNLIKNGIITYSEASQSTIYRCVKRLEEEDKTPHSNEMKRYERAHINEVWCGDTCIGPKIKLNGKKQRIYVIALIDDASRFIPAAQVFTEDNYISLMTVIKSAVSKFGIPRLFNFDNGSSYRSKQIELLTARIGSTIYFNPPNRPVGKAKIERFFRTLRDKWLGITDLNQFSSLEEIQTSLDAYILKYNQTIHTSLNGISPETRFFSESEYIKTLSEDKIERDFLLELDRTVSKDSVIKINQKEYEVDFKYAGRKIKIRHTPDLNKVYVAEADDILTPIKLLDKQANSVIKRQKFLFTQEES